jgi:hypothetical protein
MPTRPRPLLAVRLTGPADAVTAQKAGLLALIAETFGDRAICRTSTHPASYANELRFYITVTAKEVPPT